MSERDRGFLSCIVSQALVILVAFVFYFVGRHGTRAEVVRCLRAPDAESAAMACPQWMQEARR